MGVYRGEGGLPAVVKREQVLDPLTAYQITNIMEGVIQRGTGVSIKAVGKAESGVDYRAYLSNAGGGMGTLGDALKGKLKRD